jgi:hypothetical protein
MIHAWRFRLDRHLHRPSRWLVPATLAALALSNLNSTLPKWMSDAAANFRRRADFSALASQIPADAPLAASLNLGPHLIRRALTIYPVLDWPPDTFRRLPSRQAQYVLVDYLFEARHRALPRPPQHHRLIEHGYALLAERAGFALYRRPTTASPDWQPDPLAPAGDVGARIHHIKQSLR